VNGGPPPGAQALKLAFYFGEHDRHEGRFLSAAALDLFERRGLATSVLLRGAEGFGAAQRLQTDRLLSLSEDLPLVAIAVDTRERIEATASELAELAGDGLLTLERARFAADGHGPAAEPHEEVKLTVYVGRGERRGGGPAHVGVVAALHRHGVAGATVHPRPSAIATASASGRS
jgi:PII-like signaling protein